LYATKIREKVKRRNFLDFSVRYDIKKIENLNINDWYFVPGFAFNSEYQYPFILLNAQQCAFCRTLKSMACFEE
jgi:hypothetical protein